MKTKKGIPLNVNPTESFFRVLLIIPMGWVAVLGIMFLHTFVFIPLPVYLLVTALTSYSPVKHLYRVVMHKQVFTSNSSVLSSEVM